MRSSCIFDLPHSCLQAAAHGVMEDLSKIEEQRSANKGFVLENDAAVQKWLSGKINLIGEKKNIYIYVSFGQIKTIPESN